MEQQKLNIAIDGPAAAGKSTVAKQLAEALSIIYIDTGAMYRALTYVALKNNVSLTDEKALMDILHDTSITLQQSPNGQLVFVDGKDVTMTIREENVTNHVSLVATHRLVREEMVERQRQLAANQNVVMDGRDIGTHVLPDAEVKIFLIASVEERAERRHQENIAKGFSSNLKQLKQEIQERDELDMNREVSPLIKANNAIEIDTTSLSIEQVVEKILAIDTVQTFKNAVSNE
ncbi:MAG TPA: (d)CMP kinase [Candidatus Pseudogracilibacillus intestinigallinarum]|uniref:Cytidylate kinase n=1 Tax=Candidatus Pseudogracilibacillus intestinigallinarum TaxID=2838742 RepID=A0A9D1PN14_9BACI|nr:(d)CMP kinase [Candidatus Pseudogracilibacillus intestinigallinarum]